MSSASDCLYTVNSFHQYEKEKQCKHHYYLNAFINNGYALYAISLSEMYSGIMMVPDGKSLVF